MSKDTGNTLARKTKIVATNGPAGKLASPMQLAEGEQIMLYATMDSPPITDKQTVPVDFRELFDSVQKGDTLLLDDGRLALEVVTIKNRVIEALVRTGGTLPLHK